MNNTSLLNLPGNTLFQLFDLLDEKTKGRLRTTCSFFRKFKEVSEVAKFILEYYDVLASSHSLSDLKKLFFTPKHFIMLGEIHAHDEHRLINAKLTETIWNNDSIMVVESTKENLEHWKKEGSGQLKYLKKEIRETADIWDQMDASCLECTSGYTELARNVTWIAQDFYLLLADVNELTYDKLSSFINKHFYEDLQKEIYQENPETEELKNEMTESKRKKVILKNVLFTILKICSKEMSDYSGELHSFDAVRNASLKNKISNTLVKLCQSGICVAGSNHVEAIYTEIRNFCLLKGFSFLVLKPKGNLLANEELSVSNNEWSKRTAEFEKVSAIFTEKDSDHFIERAESEIDLKYLKDLVLNCDRQKIGDDDNHFSVWLLFSYFLLAFEYFRLDKE